MLKKHFFLLLLTLHCSVQAVNNKHEINDNSHEVVCNRVLVGSFYSVLAFDVALLLSRSLQSFVFGNGAVDVATENGVGKIANAIDMQSTPIIKQAYSGWRGIAGAVFSNHDVLFISSGLDQINHYDETFIREIKQGLINIEYKRDRNVLIASAAIPILIFGGIKAASNLFAENEIDNNLKKSVNYLSQNFTAKALLSLLSIYAFIKIQDYCLHSGC